jgi:hypothetical protein
MLATRSWFGTAVGLAAWAVLGVFGLWLWEQPAEVRQRRRRTGLCSRCGYDLTGNVSGVCPECGTPKR